MMKTHIIRLAWQYGLKITIKDSSNIIINHTNNDKQLEVIEIDDLILIKANRKEEIKSIHAFENKLRSYFQVQKKNKYVTLSYNQINNDLLSSSFANTVVSALEPEKLNCATILYEESFDYPKYQQLKYIVLEDKASAHIKHENNKTKIVLVGEEDQINNIIEQANLPKAHLTWNALREPITFGVTIENEEKYLETRLKDLKELTTELESEIQTLEETYRQQLKSLSWKVTKPLRTITGIAKKGMRR